MAGINEYGEIIRETKKILTEREQEIKNYIEKKDFDKAEKEKEDIVYEVKYEYLHCFKVEEILSNEIIEYIHEAFYNISIDIEKMLEERNENNIDKYLNEDEVQTIDYKEKIKEIFEKEIGNIHKSMLSNKNKPDHIFERYSEIFDRALKRLDKNIEEKVEEINVEYSKLGKEDNESKSFREKYAVPNFESIDSKRLKEQPHRIIEEQER